MRERRMIAQMGSVWKFRWQSRRTAISAALCCVLLALLFGCSGSTDNSSAASNEGLLAGNSLSPVEEEQIKNVVSDYFVRDSGAPSYDVTIEKVEQNWARVAISPVGVENSEPNLVYLQNQAATAIEAPTAEANANSGNIAPVDTTSGWAIIIGPQVNFTTDELDAAGVPPAIRN